MCVVLVDLRTDWLEGESKQGLVLDHPNLDAARLAQAARTGRSLLRLETSQIQRLDQLRQRRCQQRSWGGELHGQGPDFDGLSRAFRDPVAGSAAHVCVAACEPVFVPGRGESLSDTGWVVIIEDHANVAEMIAAPVSP